MGPHCHAYLCLILAIITGLGLLRSLRNTTQGNNTDPPLKAMLAISLMAGVIHACVSGLLIMPASQVAMIIIAGWALSLNKSTNDDQQNHAFIAQQMLFAAMLIAGAQLLFALKEIPTFARNELNTLTSYGPAVPRFWQDGRVCEYRYEYQRKNVTILSLSDNLQNICNLKISHDLMLDNCFKQYNAIGTLLALIDDWHPRGF